MHPPLALCQHASCRWATQPCRCAARLNCFLPSCHPAPPQALGQPASLRQVSRLVESVAGAGATSLRFSDFAQVGGGYLPRGPERAHCGSEFE